MKKDGFKMSDSDDKPFECTAPGCGQVRVFCLPFLQTVSSWGSLAGTGLIL